MEMLHTKVYKYDIKYHGLEMLNMTQNGSSDLYGTDLTFDPKLFGCLREPFGPELQVG